MPYAKRSTRSTRRPRRRTVRRKRAPRYRALKAPLPNKLLVKMKYADRQIAIDPSAGLAGTHLFSANGMYDPDVAIGGHQCRGFDELMAMYDHFTVISSKVTATFTLQNSAAAIRNNAILWIALKDSSTTFTDPNDYIEGRNVTFKHFGSTTASSSNVVSLSKTFSCKKFLGISHPLSSSVVRGSAAGNPTEGAYYHIGVACQDPLIDSAPFNVTVYIEYVAVLTEPRQPGQS